MVRFRPRPMADWSLSRRFATAGGLIMLAAMLGIGYWVTTRIESGVVRNTANATALFTVQTGGTLALTDLLFV